MTRKLFFLLVLSPLLSWGQVTYPSNGAPDIDHNLHVLRGARVHVDFKTTLSSADVWLRDGSIVKVVEGEPVPPQAIIHDCSGSHIYPSFIDLYSDYGMPAVKKVKRDGPQIERPDKSTGGWNTAIRPEVGAVSQFGINMEQAKNLRSQGFGAVLSLQKDGIIRGTGALVSLGADNEASAIIAPQAAQIMSMDKGSSTMDYPSSRMGAIALLRQTLYDAQWYSQSAEEKVYNASLEALASQLDLPQIMVSKEKNDILRGDRIGDEFGFQYIFIGSGNEYERVHDMRAAGGLIVLPLKFPEAYDMSDPFASQQVSLHDLRHWEQAPSNASYLNGLGVDIAFTSDGLKDAKGFLDALRKTVKHGLSKDSALKALTFTPASALGMNDKIGALRAGMRADFFVSDGDIFEPGSTILSSWCGGRAFAVSPNDRTEISGEYDLNIDGKRYTMQLTDKKSTLISGKDTVALEVKEFAREVNMTFSLEEGLYRLHGLANPRMSIWSGSGTGPKGKALSWNSIRKDKRVTQSKVDTSSRPNKISRLSYPNTGYGWTDAPLMENVVIRNATVWTNTEQGILEDADVVISEGKIVAVGHNLDTKTLYKREKDMPAFRTIEAYGKHVTAGIIDEHSHIAITGGVNESGQACSAEVSIGDVVDPEDTDIYHALSGGVTSCQLLHGSANPIGGQSALVKLHWGKNAEEMKIDDAPGFIKFALGENVKQSNWGAKFNKRFPQTRMGVEQVFYDHFHRAKSYAEEMSLHQDNMQGYLKRERKGLSITFPRRDLELETLSQILDGTRFISCHSYVQSEINMLMHVADSMNFRLNTFTHILEGYKVADKMKAHGAGASTFSDWWAYKYEVREATPYNAALLHAMGVTVAINSDDAEMGRRLNQEAAKGVKYGGMSEEEAWKMVTLNPAKLLHLDDRTGSLQVGLDADLVIWSGNPLSVYTKAERTYVDGICYFDHTEDTEQRKRIAEERARLIEKMQGDKGPKSSPKAQGKHRYHCDHIGE